MVTAYKTVLVGSEMGEMGKQLEDKHYILLTGERQEMTLYMSLGYCTTP